MFLENKLERFQPCADSTFWHCSVWRAPYSLFIINDVEEMTYIHQCCINVVAALPIYRYEERQASVWRQDIHTAILFMISW